MAHLWQRQEVVASELPQVSAALTRPSKRQIPAHTALRGPSEPRSGAGWAGGGDAGSQEQRVPPQTELLMTDATKASG